MRNTLKSFIRLLQPFVQGHTNKWLTVATKIVFLISSCASGGRMHTDYKGTIYVDWQKYLMILFGYKMCVLIEYTYRQTFHFLTGGVYKLKHFFPPLGDFRDYSGRIAIITRFLSSLFLIIYIT